MRKTEHRFGETFGFARVWFSSPVFFARFLPGFVRPFFAPFLPIFWPKNAHFSPGLAQFVRFCPNSPGFVRIRLSPVCLVSGIPGVGPWTRSFVD